MATISRLPFWKRVERFQQLVKRDDWDIFDLIWVFTGKY